MLKYMDEQLMPPSSPAVSARRLARMVGKIAVIIFVVETIIMLSMYGWASDDVTVFESMLDSTMLTLAASPLIYIWVARPFAEEAAAARNELSNQLSETRQLLEQNIRLKEKLQQFTEISADIHERTLQRIGADLHDGPAQSLTFALLQIDRINRALSKSADTSKIDDLKRLRGVVYDTTSEIRGISTGLALPELNTLSLQDVVELAVHRHKVATGAAISVVFNSKVKATQSQKACIYRVIQEALSNAFKHGSATTVEVQVRDAPELTVTVTDNGQGFDVASVVNKGLGLLGMRARVEALRGDFDVQSQPQRGTTIRAQFRSPVPAHGAVP